MMQGISPSMNAISALPLKLARTEMLKDSTRKLELEKSRTLLEFLIHMKLQKAQILILELTS
jgi:hypothetical protein